MEDIGIVMTLYLIVQIGDIITTKKVIQRGGYETNWLIYLFMLVFGNGWFIAKTIGTIGAAVIMLAANRPEYIHAVTGLTAFYVINNWMILRK